eukprot:311571-Chlamydomonas_euryale.AAC.1
MQVPSSIGGAASVVEVNTAAGTGTGDVVWGPHLAGYPAPCPTCAGVGPHNANRSYASSPSTSATDTLTCLRLSPPRHSNAAAMTLQWGSVDVIRLERFKVRGLEQIGGTAPDRCARAGRKGLASFEGLHQIRGLRPTAERTSHYVQGTSARWNRLCGISPAA